MVRLLIYRIVQLFITLIGINTILFFALRVSGNPAAVLLGAHATTEALRDMEVFLGLDKPLYVQYYLSLIGIINLDFGVSIRSGRDALSMVLERLPISLELVGSALLIAVLVSLPIGIFSAIRRRSYLSRILMISAFIGQAMPIFWTGILLILLFAVTWGLLPTSGWTSLKHMILPAITLGSVLMAKLARIIRSEMIESISQDYIRTARSKGISEFQVIMKHGFINALIPVITVIGTELGQLIGAAVITETIFSVPGIGRMMVDATLARDYPLIQASVFVVACIVVFLNTAVDLLYLLIDPRIRINK